ncbi:MAG: hypothetical protein KAJ03_04075 [Gammaproteobacteria bacterium]|nr:hypothetical protein [Gammaproteobacteria bacterium]
MIDEKKIKMCELQDNQLFWYDKQLFIYSTPNKKKKEGEKEDDMISISVPETGEGFIGFEQRNYHKNTTVVPVIDAREEARLWFDILRKVDPYYISGPPEYVPTSIMARVEEMAAKHCEQSLYLCLYLSSCLSRRGFTYDESYDNAMTEVKKLRKILNTD